MAPGGNVGRFFSSQLKGGKDERSFASPTSAIGATYDHTFTSAGTFPYFCRPHCGSGMTGTVNVAAPASPGAVPDGTTVPGTPLQLGKGAGDTIDLTWGASCSAGASNYAVYEGSLPIAGAYNHVPKNCNLGNVTSTNLTPAPDTSSYYLIVPETASTEGSYGRSSASEISQGASPCHPQLVQPCP